MLAGSSIDELQNLMLDQNAKYLYLGGIHPTSEDEGKFQRTMEILQKINIDCEKRRYFTLFAV